MWKVRIDFKGYTGTKMKHDRETRGQGKLKAVSDNISF